MSKFLISLKRGFLIGKINKKARISSLILLTLAFHMAVAAAPQSEIKPTPESLTQLSSIVAKSLMESHYRTIDVVITAYSSTPEETDDTPFITASNTYVRDGIVAANFLPFGTQIRIPELFGDKVFVVEDRMHRRFSDRVDIWFPNKESAKNFGLRQATVQIF